MELRSGHAAGNVASMLWTSAERLPDKPAVIERDRSVTYSELTSRARLVARALADDGLQPGDRVCILLDRGADAVAAYFGVLAAGGIAVMLNPTLKPRQVEYALNHSGARTFLTSGEMLSRMHRLPESPATLMEIGRTGEAGDWRPLPLEASVPAQITFTSGSTGLPKGVVASHANVWAAIETVSDYLGIAGEDRIAGLLPFSGVYGANQMLCSVFKGSTLVVPTSPLMNQVALELREGQVSVLAAVPPLWTQLLQAPAFTEEPIPTLRILQNAGGHLAPAISRRVRDAQPTGRLFLQYGMTEVFRSTFLPPEELERRPDSMGRPMAGAEVLGVRDDLTLCDPGEVGELVHAGPTVTLGYWGEPERTATVFRPHPLPSRQGEVAVFSGDMVRRDEEGFLYYVGRRDRMIKTLGFRVGPDEVLDVLHASGQIIDGLVTAEPDDVRGDAVIAYVVLAEGGSLRDLTAYARLELPRYMQPVRIEVRDALPRNANGKHDLIALREQEAARAAAAMASENAGPQVE
jgi:acyl-CoA synthetase (AMP-forming)/AMP-acid ligase II